MKNKKQKGSFDFFSLTIRENEWRMNRIMGAVALVCDGIMALCYLLNLVGIFTLSSTKLLFITLVLFPFSLYAFLVGTIFKVKRLWIKYSLMGVFWLDVTLLFANVSMHAVLILCMPVVLSLLYSSRRFTAVTSLFGVAAIFAAHLFSVVHSVVNDPLVNTFYRSLVFGYVPRILQYGVVCLIAGFVSRNNTQMMNKGYYYVQRANELLEQQRSSQYETIKNLATITENKSFETGEHISRVYSYMHILTTHMGLDAETVYAVSMAAMLHDVGKLRVPDSILHKPGKLTAEEFEVIKGHAGDGKLLLANTGNELLEMASIIADQHHERWDGKGYHGLVGDEIDRYSQLMSVIDVFDALTSVRCYKPAWTFEDAYAEILRNRGTQFSPMAVDLFRAAIDEIRTVYDESRKMAGRTDAVLQQM